MKKVSKITLWVLFCNQYCSYRSVFYEYERTKPIAGHTLI